MSTKHDEEVLEQLAFEMYRDLAMYSRENDERLRAVQRAVGECYPDGPNHLDILALMGWCLYCLRVAGLDPTVALRVLIEQSVQLDVAEQRGPSS